MLCRCDRAPEPQTEEVFGTIQVGWSDPAEQRLHGFVVGKIRGKAFAALG
jgi:hypothetical protein